VTIGEVMLDVLGPEAAGGALQAPIVVRPGGTPLTAALAAHAAGASTMLVGRVGDDAAAAAIRAGLANAGVEAALASRFEILCVTYAAEGAVLYRDGTAERLPPTGRSGTGAGDALAGSLLARL
jgi:sugar/nucleoside kinase (ribokinase family)